MEKHNHMIPPGTLIKKNNIWRAHASAGKNVKIHGILTNNNTCIDKIYYRSIRTERKFKKSSIKSAFRVFELFHSSGLSKQKETVLQFQKSKGKEEDL